jgi:YidC/Oxa1 family membrane protein insertase
MSAFFTWIQRIGVLALALGLAAGLSVGPTAGAQTQTQTQTQAPEALTPALKSYERDGRTELLVRAKLTEYVLSAQDGTLRSVYLYFTPVGMAPVELVPDTETKPEPETGALQRRYTRDARFPFEIWGELDGQRLEELTYTAEAERLDGRLLVRFTAQLGDLRLTKTFVIWDNPYYTLNVRLELENTGDEALTLPQGVQLYLGRGVGRAPSLQQVRYLAGGQVTDKLLDVPGFEGLGFVGGGLVFFLKVLEAQSPLIPLQQALGEQSAALSVEIPALTLGPGEAKRYAFELYAGRAKYTLLRHVGLGDLAPPGFFAGFIVPVVEFLNWLYRATGNYGWAIILFTLLVRILLFPLTRQQFHAMAKMAQLRPKLERLQQRYPTYRRLKELHPDWSQEELMRRDRENRQALQQKMMELYREEGVNPLGGCLPVLIQFPILIILWRAILDSAELIHLSPGFLWMPDLSLRDPYYLIVALTALAMILQTKTTPTLTPSGQGPNQMVMMLFSVGIMVVFLKDFPSGLWLYYFLTTLIQVGQQVFISWELEHLKLQKAAAEAGESPSNPKAQASGATKSKSESGSGPGP